MTVRKVDEKRYIIFLGKSLKFPFTNSFEKVEGESCVLQDLEQGLMTDPGERIMNPFIGGGLNSFIWENIDQAERAGQQRIIQIVDRDPRVSLISITSKIERNLDLIIYGISIFIKKTNSSVNWVVTAQPSGRIDR